MKLEFTADDALEWAVADSVGVSVIKARMERGERLVVKLGIDPTSPHVHLGRTLPLWRLRAFQELGHSIVFIIGDFTGQVGDTSDKESERPMLTAEEVGQNLQGYFEQVWKVLNPELRGQVTIRRNSEWLSGLTLADISQMADSFSVNTFIKRELVAKRLGEGSRVSLREMLYPLMQGYDSVEVRADVELGGTDQRFNLLAGRTLQAKAGMPPQAIIMNPLLSGTDGRKMSSSWGNVISLTDSPTDLFGKVMSIPDTLIKEYLLFLPRSAQPFTEQELGVQLNVGQNPKDLKMELAHALVELYFGASQADTENSHFQNRFSKRQTDRTVKSQPGVTLFELVATDPQWGQSRGELRRVFKGNGVEWDGAKVTDESFTVVSGTHSLKVGKHILVTVVA